MKNYLSKIVDLIIDRPLGSAHPEHGFIYPLNYGYIPNTLAGDNEPIDAYLLGVYEPIQQFKGKVIAWVDRLDDNEGKLVIAQVESSDFTEAQVKALIHFQERFFHTEIVMAEKPTASSRIRPIVLALIRRGNEILVESYRDPIKAEYFYRFLGGGIEFHERAAAAIQRELLEEIGAKKVKVLQHIVTLENLFTFKGKDEHEIVYCYEVEIDAHFYEKIAFQKEEGLDLSQAIWVDKNVFLQKEAKLYPPEILPFL